jgi:DNA-binding MarR family transcriptional regulator
VAKLAEEKALYVVNEPESAEVEVSFKNPVRELGFAQIEHIIGLDVDLSDGAYRTLSILHYFWQQKKRAFPSLETLAKLRGKSERTVSEHLAELTEKGIISRARRMGTSSMTYLEDLPQSYAEAATAILEERALRKTARKTGRKLPVEAEANFHLRITREEEQVVEPTTPSMESPSHESQPSPAEQAIEQTIFGLGWKERMEIRELAEKDAGLVSLTQALQEFRAKVFAGEYKANWGTLRKFWNNVMSTNALRAPAPAVIEMPEYQRNIKWAT